ncbi:MAG TPA: hypothetical protein VJN88_02805 [Ktedonobacterales bacterium]|nr:hypothetical protein [Ktedonobacterales bacterium]
MPERFQHDFLERSATAFKGKSALGKWANAATAMGAAYGLVKDQNNNATSYEVFKCPACGCEALYQYRRQNGTTNWAKFADIRYCAR